MHIFTSGVILVAKENAKIFESEAKFIALVFSC
jgi:hypothetical protein